MRISNLFLKIARGEPTSERQKLEFTAGTGILGDVNANGESSRQVLIVSGPVLSSLGIAPGALRENIVVDGLVDGMPSGQILGIGNVILRLTYQCEPCYRLEEVRKGLVRQLLGKRGYLARVIAGGAISRLDRIVTLAPRLAEIPYDPRKRLASLLACVPSGSVVTFSQIRATLGYSSGYLRALPVLLKRVARDLPVHRVVATDRSLIDRHVVGQRQLLLSEGIRLTEASSVPARYLWDARGYFGDEEAVAALVQPEWQRNAYVMRNDSNQH